jgi:hypothetical protein
MKEENSVKIMSSNKSEKNRLFRKEDKNVVISFEENWMRENSSTQKGLTL